MIKNERGYVYNFSYHIVWVTKYRKPVFTTPKLVQDMKDAINYLAGNHDVEIQSMEVMHDHVHLLVSFKPKLAPADVVKILKGSSARLWFTAHPETKRKLWGGHLWSPSYYIGTLGDMSKQVVEEYINNQRTEKSNAGRPSKKDN